MRLYPAFLNLKGRNVLVIGGGAVAARKARGLLRAGARVWAVSPRFEASFPGRARRIRRPYRASDVVGRFLVVAATDDPELNRSASRDAGAAGALSNVADDPKACDILVPAILRRGRLTLAVGTSGASPALSRRIRRELSEIYDASYGPYVDLLETLRPVVLREMGDPPRRRAVLKRLASAEFARIFREDGRAAARHAMLRVIREAVAG